MALNHQQPDRAPISSGFAKAPVKEGEIIFAERNPGRDYSGHYYADFGYDCGNENYWLHGADGGRLAILNSESGETRGARLVWTGAGC